MLRSQEQFNDVKRKRLVLVVDDEEINREILGLSLEDIYDVLYAEDGEEALEIIRTHSSRLSMVLLDLMMPKIPGIEVLRRIKGDPATAQIPVIVTTADQGAEIQSLQLGASDFIPKPYPPTGVIQARMQRIIELSEDRQIILSTERDPLTGLYNKEFFFRYAEQNDHFHPETAMDAILLDVNHFHILNERYGRSYADTILTRLGKRLETMAIEAGGIACRREADTFLLYFPHREDYRPMLEELSADLAEDTGSNNRVRLRMGIYSNADKSLEVERRFDRAKSAADTVRNSFTKTIGYYNMDLHDKELYAEQLMEDFQAAIEEHQFAVFYQPKFNIRPEIPILSSAEALVRWKHPRLGMISPGVFIPLFEENGLILELDIYVWRETARQIKAWKDTMGFSVPVSVNVSRIDMYEPDLIPTLLSIVEENGLTTRDFYLEITESAYTQDSMQIIDTVGKMRELGFTVEMDDFGTGYSSLNMISSLPIDALKLDMQFIRTAFREKRDTRMLEVIIDIADYLSVPVIAEGVETAEQLRALRGMGCDMVQGYYFSKPVPSEEYETFLLARKAVGVLVAGDAVPAIPAEAIRSEEGASLNTLFQALSPDYESIYYIDTRNSHYVEIVSKGKYRDLRIQDSGADFFADTRDNLKRFCYPDDLERVGRAMEKNTLLAGLSQGGSVSLLYRLLIDGAPVFYCLRAARMDAKNDPHIVVGVRCVDRDVTAALGQESSTVPSREFSSIAQALSSDFECVYYVDLLSDCYTELAARGAFHSLDIQTTGRAFFTELRDNLGRILWPEDVERVTSAMEKGTLLSLLTEERSATVDCRLSIDGKPVWYRLRSVLAQGSSTHHIVVSVNNIDIQVAQDRALLEAKEKTITFSSIARALAADYMSLYYVDTLTDEFTEFTSRDEYQELDLVREGMDFFGVSRENALRVVDHEDRDKFLQSFTKENILRELELHQTFSLLYRLLLDGKSIYVSLTAMPMERTSHPHIVIGVRNVDAQMQREATYTRALEEARRLAWIDDITNVKNKRAFQEARRAIDDRLAKGEDQPFAAAVFRVRPPGGSGPLDDDQLRDGCRLVCQVFKHSPVYRISDDSFAAILRGGDYDRRAELEDQMVRARTTRPAQGLPLVDWGMGVLGAEDGSFDPVFRRAEDALARED